MAIVKFLEDVELQQLAELVGGLFVHILVRDAQQLNHSFTGDNLPKEMSAEDRAKIPTDETERWKTHQQVFVGVAWDMLLGNMAPGIQSKLNEAKERFLADLYAHPPATT